MYELTKAIVVSFHLGLGLLFFVACGNKNQAEQTNQEKPMRAPHPYFSAHQNDGSWIMEMEMNGNFTFKNYDLNLQYEAKTPNPVAFQDSSGQGLQWIFSPNEFTQITLKIFEKNCFNLNGNNNTFYLEITHDKATIYKLQECGTYHSKLGFSNEYVFVSDNNIPLTLPNIVITKIPYSNLLDGKMGCKTFRGQLFLKDQTIALISDVTYYENCHESPEETLFVEEFFNKKYTFVFTNNNEQLKLIDKNHNFVLKKKS